MSAWLPIKSLFSDAAFIGIKPSDSALSEKVYGRIFFKNKALCVSPIHGLSTHMTKGVMTPLVDWEIICQENIDMMKKEGIWK